MFLVNLAKNLTWYLIIKEDMHIGGSAIVANHLSDFVKKISLISDFGYESSIRKLLDKKLKKNITHIALKPSENYKSSIKTRFIDSVSNYKLFGSYLIPNLEIKKFYQILSKSLVNILNNHDVVIITDYSNNFFDLNSLKKIKQSKKFICGMAQKIQIIQYFIPWNTLRTLISYA